MLAGPGTQGENGWRDADDNAGEGEVAMWGDVRKSGLFRTGPHAGHKVGARAFEDMHGAGVAMAGSGGAIRNHFQTVAFFGAGESDALVLALQVGFLVVGTGIDPVFETEESKRSCA